MALIGKLNSSPCNADAAIIQFGTGILGKLAHFRQ
jgi:hypothetical protein